MGILGENKLFTKEDDDSGVSEAITRALWKIDKEENETLSSHDTGISEGLSIDKLISGDLKTTSIEITF